MKVGLANRWKGKIAQETWLCESTSPGKRSRPVFTTVAPFRLQVELTQTMVFIMVFVIALLIASFFYPDLPKFLTTSFTSRGMIMNAIAIGIAIAIVSGAASVIWNQPTGNAGAPGAPVELVAMAAGVLILIVVLIIASSVVTSKS